MLQSYLLRRCLEPLKAEPQEVCKGVQTPILTRYDWKTRDNTFQLLFSLWMSRASGMIEQCLPSHLRFEGMTGAYFENPKTPRSVIQVRSPLHWFGSNRGSLGFLPFNNHLPFRSTYFRRAPRVAGSGLHRLRGRHLSR